jgi:hypothetical protein
VNPNSEACLFLREWLEIPPATNHLVTYSRPTPESGTNWHQNSRRSGGSPQPTWPRREKSIITF